MLRPDFIAYPETYVLLAEALKDIRFDGQALNRIVAICSAWEAAIQVHGDVLAKVEVYSEDIGLTFRGFAKCK